jgi:hypothetical protein
MAVRERLALVKRVQPAAGIVEEIMNGAAHQFNEVAGIIPQSDHKPQ